MVIGKVRPWTVISLLAVSVLITGGMLSYEVRRSENMPGEGCR
jgi:hypothetical protein